MSNLPVYNLEGEKVGTVPRPSMLSVPVDEKLIHRYFVWVRTMIRSTIAHTKTRGEISGGGKKPWKQKGTGRARTGSTRNPLWRGGGTIFGPRSTQTYATRMPRNERRKALFSALSSKADKNGIVIVDEWKVEPLKTKTVATILDKLPIEGDKKILQVFPSYDAEAIRPVRNIANLTPCTFSQLNIVNVLNSDIVLITKDGLTQLEQHFTPQS